MGILDRCSPSGGAGQRHRHRRCAQRAAAVRRDRIRPTSDKHLLQPLTRGFGIPGINFNSNELAPKGKSCGTGSSRPTERVHDNAEMAWARVNKATRKLLRKGAGWVPLGFGKPFRR